VTATTEKNLPDMDMCLTCHDDKKAPGDCRTCHDNLADLKPAGHKSPWFMNKEHGRDARFNRMDCAKCHQESSCDACHKGQLSTRIHDLNFSFTHGIEARRGDKDCTVCHETQRFCITCHEAIK